MIVLDTNVVLRIVKGEGRIGSKARNILDGTDRRYCSAMVQWELAMLVDKRRIGLDDTVSAWMERAARLLHLIEVPVSGAIASDAGSLQGSIHGDPCDRIMIATARHFGCPLITTDGKILTYAASGHVQAIDARR